MSSHATETRTKVGKFLTIKLAAETYGIHIQHVREITGMLPFTAMPNTPAAIKGIFNLRGKTMPLVDLRTKFSMSQKEYSRETCIVVVDIPSRLGRLSIGIVVDSVCDVVRIDPSAIEPPPAFGIRVDTSFLLGIARTKSEIILLLEIEKVLNSSELTAAESATLEAVKAPPSP